MPGQILCVLLVWFPVLQNPLVIQGGGIGGRNKIDLSQARFSECYLFGFQRCPLVTRVVGLGGREGADAQSGWNGRQPGSTDL